MPAGNKYLLLYIYKKNSTRKSLTLIESYNLQNETFTFAKLLQTFLNNFPECC